MAQIPMSNSAPKAPVAPQQQQAKKSFDAIPENTIVDVEVVDVEVRDLPEWFITKFNVKDKQEVSFHFKVVGDKHKNRHLWGSARPILNQSDNCRLRIWIQEILGMDALPEDYVFDTDQFTGLNARVLVGTRVAQDGTTKNKVLDVLRSNNVTEFGEEMF